MVSFFSQTQTTPHGLSGTAQLLASVKARFYPEVVVVAGDASSIPASTAATASATTAAGSWSLLFSLPHLIMLSNLHNFFGARSSRKPSIQPNEYMDSVIANTKVAMKER
jgi:hypothetical protein